MVPATNWYHLYQAVNHFAARGFKYVEAPWTAPQEIIRATCAEDRWAIRSSIGGLVGSAEQSFMALDKSGDLGKGEFVACTPCFRNEDYPDEWHLKTFMKAELYINDDVSDERLETLLSDVEGFFRGLLLPDEQEYLRCVPMADGSTDYELFGIEIGSYGRRKHDSLTWLYGTAIAEPRFSSACRRMRNYIELPF